MSELFRKAEIINSSNGNPSLRAPTYLICYSASLIKDLINDHQSLMESYHAAADAYEKKDFNKLKKHLAKLKESLTGHFLKKNRKLFPYLHDYYQGDRKNEITLHSFKKELANFGNFAFSHLRKYTLFVASFDEEFSNEFDALGDALMARIEAEQSLLYPMYLPVENTVAVE